RIIPLSECRRRLIMPNDVVISESIFPSRGRNPSALGFNTGRNGVHTSRTMMFAELSTLLQHLPVDARRVDFEEAILRENVLAKSTISTRKRTFDHLISLYALDPVVPVFRLLRHFWGLDPAGRPLIALVAARARDSLL